LQVYESEDGEAAVERACEVKPDVVVIDIVMPKMSGIEATYELRRCAVSYPIPRSF
jgi:CheY-like chemotaxis protein